MSHRTMHAYRAALVFAALLSPLAAPPCAASAPAATVEYLGVGTERGSGTTSSTSERLRVTSAGATHSDVQLAVPNKSPVALTVRRLADGELQFPYNDDAVDCYNMARAFAARANPAKSVGTVYEMNVLSDLGRTMIRIPVAVQEFVISAVYPQIVVRGDGRREVIQSGKAVRTDTVLEGRVSATGQGIHDVYIQTNTYVGTRLAAIHSCALRASTPSSPTSATQVAL
jgi:hypothetical protein